MSDIVLQNLLSPVVLFFVLGLFASVIGSDLRFPKGLSETLSIYLLIAIGLKGGMSLSHYSFADTLKPMIGACFLGTVIPILTVIILRMMKMDFKNAVALGATYGSVSIVTYGAGVSFLEHTDTSYETYMNGIVVLMEIPAIFIALTLLSIKKSGGAQPAPTVRSLGLIAVNPLPFLSLQLLKESLFGKSVLLLSGSLLVGFISGTAALPFVKPLFIDLYQSFLLLFLLNMGIMVGQTLAVVRKQGGKLLAFALLMPVGFGVLGIFTGLVSGLSLGGTTLMGILAASASYIAAPAALRTSVPEANPSIYLGSALGITFPFNLTVGIPLLFSIAHWLH
ncbi:sodium-dependent bicarbonate transport family permease [Desmospora profundinema]|uniref:Sodium-dependent bicarbonate transport family permease n=1 Tax=Desmospora profundinema TaxID=1571184 RepID=A0ABU1IQ01_9BACL|nr:sodium-dependent bicarbonate transport family permease [Desmospora profundinema]MDR6226488.1 hypothetical protein [Desmospora profundinema]